MTTAMIASEDEQVRAFLDGYSGYAKESPGDNPGNLRAMFYGDDGVGKTIAGLALLNYIVPADRRIILIDTSENRLSINNHAGLQTLLSDGSPRIFRLPFRGETWLRTLATVIRAGEVPFNNVGGLQFDEYATMADSFLGQILEAQEERDPDRPKDDATWPEYKMLLRKMRNLNRNFGSLDGVHCTYIAHLRTSDIGPFNKPIHKPNFTPSVGPEIRKPMHIIAEVTLDDDGNRMFQVMPDKHHTAKCKVGGITTKEVGFEELAVKTKAWLNGVNTTNDQPTQPTEVHKVEEDDFDV